MNKNTTKTHSMFFHVALKLFICALTATKLARMPTQAHPLAHPTPQTTANLAQPRSHPEHDTTHARQPSSGSITRSRRISFTSSHHGVISHITLHGVTAATVSVRGGTAEESIPSLAPHEHADTTHARGHKQETTTIDQCNREFVINITMLTMRRHWSLVRVRAAALFGKYIHP